MSGNSSKELEFARILERVRRVAREQGNCISQEQVREEFALLALGDQQLDMVFDYLKKHKISIGEQGDPDAFLTDEEKETVCRIAKEAGVDFVKTSTGFGTAGATVHDVALMRRVVGSTIGVKAAGGIRDLDSALALIQAGATRIGTSSGIQIVESYKELKKGL